MLARAPEALSVKWKFHTYNKNSSGTLLSKKAILNSYKSDIYVVRSCRNLILQNPFQILLCSYSQLKESGMALHGFVLHQCAKFSYAKHYPV